MKIPGIRFGGVGDFLLVFDVVGLFQKFFHTSVSLSFRLKVFSMYFPIIRITIALTFNNRFTVPFFCSDYYKSCITYFLLVSCVHNFSIY